MENFRIHGRHQRGSKSFLLLSYAEFYENQPKETDFRNFTLNVQNMS
jgi:hypothetical protein